MVADVLEQVASGMTWEAIIEEWRGALRKEAIAEAIKLDTSHGFAHRDLLNLKGIAEKTPLFNQDYNDALTFAENDLKSNWEYYKKRFLEGKDE